MDATLELMDSGGGGGGGMVSGGSNSTVSSSCSHPDESELELGLGLSLGGSKSAPWGQYGRILTAKDFPSRVSKSSSSSSSSSATKANNVSCGTKRAADSSSPPRSGVSQVVGWPPIRTYRMNNLVSQTKSPASEEFASIIEKSKSKLIDKTRGGNKINSDAKDKSFVKASLYVKVNMDGVMIGRKVDLGAHTNYNDLSSTLDEMFFMPTTTGHSRCSNLDEKSGMTDGAVRPRLLDGSSEFVITYEDKDGDWMLVGDVPWEIFVCSVKRLRIVRKSEANGQGTTPSICQERNGRPI